MSAWRLKDAKESCDTVFERALSGDPQVVTHHGVPKLVVVTYANYQASCQTKHSVIDTLTSCPCDLTTLLNDDASTLPTAFDRAGHAHAKVMYHVEEVHPLSDG